MSMKKRDILIRFSKIFAYLNFLSVITDNGISKKEVHAEPELG